MEEKDAKIVHLESLLDESTMNLHLKQLTDLASDLKEKVAILEDEKIGREQDVEQLRRDLEGTETERRSFVEQLEAARMSLIKAEIDIKGKYRAFG